MRYTFWFCCLIAAFSVATSRPYRDRLTSRRRNRHQLRPTVQEITSRPRDVTSPTVVSRKTPRRGRWNSPIGPLDLTLVTSLPVTSLPDTDTSGRHVTRRERRRRKGRLGKQSSGRVQEDDNDGSSAGTRQSDVTQPLPGDMTSSTTADNMYENVTMTSCTGQCQQNTSATDVIGPPRAGSACDQLTCPRNKVCMLNIQGLPMCRCISVYHCKGSDRRPVCSTEGITFRNKCYLRAEECASNRRIRLLRRGACVRNSGGLESVTGTATGRRDGGLLGKTTDERQEGRRRSRKGNRRRPKRKDGIRGVKRTG